MKLHELKILPKYYEKVLCREKKFEIRKDDRNFKVGDIIRLCEHDGKEFTGRDSLYNITYKLDGGEYGLEKGYCILSIIPYEEIDKNQEELFKNKLKIRNKGNQNNLKGYGDYGIDLNDMFCDVIIEEE